MRQAKDSTSTGRSEFRVEALAESGGYWRPILLIGGAFWMVGTIAAVMEMSPYAGKMMGGEYILSNLSRSVQHVAMFGLAAIGYRVAIALGMPLGARAGLRVLVLNIIIAAAVIGLAPIVTNLAAELIDMRNWVLHGTLDISLKEWGIALRFFLPLYIVGLCAVALFLVARHRHLEMLRTTELERAYATARLAALSAQLQPHFLFNSLNAISELIEEDPRRAVAVVARLGDFLRHALASSDLLWVDLADELKGLEAYLAIQQIRFSDRLTVSIRAGPEATSVRLPALLLQPLAENAIEHGDTGATSLLLVDVTASIVGDRLRIVVHNSRPRLPAPLPAGAFGHGLANVSMRLKAAYGAAATLHVGPDNQDGTSAIVEVPVEPPATFGGVANEGP